MEELGGMSSSAPEVATLEPATVSQPAPSSYPRPALIRGIRWLASYAWLAVLLAYLIPVGINVAQLASQGGVDAIGAQITSALYVDQASSFWLTNPALLVLAGITVVLLLVASVVAVIDRRRERKALQARRVAVLSQSQIAEAQRAVAAERDRADHAERKRVETESRVAALERAHQDAEARAQAAIEQARRAAASPPLTFAAAPPTAQARGGGSEWTPTMASPATVRAPGWTASKPILMGKLGARIDGWADTVEGLADRAPALLQTFAQDLPQHLMPHVQPMTALLGIAGLDALAVGVDNPVMPRSWPLIGRAFAVIPTSIPTLLGFKIAGKQRDYQLACITPGATVAININRTGQDLYLCWDLFVRRVWNEVTVALVIGLAALWSVLVAVLTMIGISRLGQACQTYNGRTICYATGIDTGALIRADLIGVIPNFLISAVVITLFFMALGTFIKGHHLWYFVKGIDLFEQHDIGALILVVDKTLRKAADKVGIDTKILRAKERFSAGSPARLI
jgi:hypothetical protein